MAYGLKQTPFFNLRQWIKLWKQKPPFLAGFFLNKI